MNADRKTVLIMAAGTGGHVFPALSIAKELQRRNVDIAWLVTPTGMENKLLEKQPYSRFPITVHGLKGAGILRLFLAPLMLIHSLWQSLAVMRQVRPHCVLGMGGYVAGPGGLAAMLSRRPLVIHEQNAVAGLTNRILARFADRICAAFPGTFQGNGKIVETGNPVRAPIRALYEQNNKEVDGGRPMRLLILGGSQGAAAINRLIPSVLTTFSEQQRPWVWHQCGERTVEEVRGLYRAADLQFGETLRVEAFIDDMAAAYDWADLVVCRAGASTVAELAVAGLPAVLVPYPHHKDQQQLHNANWLVDVGAAFLLPQEQLDEARLETVLQDLMNDRSRLFAMRQRARELAILDASEVIATTCLELANA